MEGEGERLTAKNRIDLPIAKGWHAAPHTFDLTAEI
jgi:hypothetical protein